MKKEPYRPIGVVEITPEKMKELAEEGLRLRRELERRMAPMFVITPEIWRRRLR